MKINTALLGILVTVTQLDKTLAKFEGQFVTKDELRILEKELIDRLRQYLDNR
jgi:hypothetical protein